MIEEIAKGEAMGARGSIMACFDDTGLDDLAWRSPQL
jgi:Asp/Glu/hydantoin racemase